MRIMKKLFLLLIFILTIQFAFGQVDTKYFPKGDAFEQVEYIKSNQRALIIDSQFIEDI